MTMTIELPARRWSRLVPLLVLLLTARQPAARGESWPCYGADAQRSRATTNRIAPPLALAWRAAFAQPPHPAWPEPRKELHRIDFDYCFQPVIASGRVFIGSSADDSVRALDLQTGATLWTFITGGPVRFAPTIERDKCYVVSDDGNLYCLNATSGKEIWRFRPGPSSRLLVGNERLISRWPLRSGLSIDDGTLYLTAGMWPAEGVFVYALDAETGGVLWRNDTCGLVYVNYPHRPASAIGGVAPQGYCATGRDVLLVPAGRSMPGGFDKTTGRLLFCNTDVGKNWWMGGARSAIAGDYFLNPSTLGTFSFSRGRPDAAQPVAYDGTHVYDLATGAKAKQRFLPDTYGHSNGAYLTVAARDTLFALTSDRLTATSMKEPLDRSFRRGLWAVPYDGTRAYEMVLTGGHLLVGALGRVSAYDAVTGSNVWQVAVQGEARGLAVADGALVVSTHRGELLCLRAPTTGAAVAHDTHPADTPRRSPLTAADSAIANALRASKMTTGFALILDATGAGTAERLAADTSMRVVHLAPDAESCAALRAHLLDQTAWHGSRIAVLPLERLPDLPNGFANTIVCANPVDTAQMTELLRVLHPYTGSLFVRDGERKTLATATQQAGLATPPLEKAGPWARLIAPPAPEAAQELTPPFELLWFGGPGPGDMADRHIQTAPRPKAANGRYFVIGDHHVLGVDAFNGVQLWSVPVHDACVRDWQLPSVLRNTYSDAIAMAVDDHVVRLELGAGVVVDLDPRDGAVLATYGLRHPTRRFGLAEPRTFALPYPTSVGDALDAALDEEAPTLLDTRTTTRDDTITGGVTLTPTAAGLRLTLTAEHKRHSLWDRWEVYFDFRPEASRHGLYTGGAFQFTVFPFTTYTKRDTFKFHLNYPRAIAYVPKPKDNDAVWDRPPYWLTAAGPRHPTPTLTGARDENHTTTELLLPWEELDRLLGRRPTTFAFAADLTVMQEADDVEALTAAFFADAAAPRVNNGWPLFDLSQQQDAAVPVPPADPQRPALSELPDITDHPPPSQDTAYAALPAYRVNPVTGDFTRRLFRPSYGCAAPVSKDNISFFRSATLAYHDYADDSGVRNFPGVRPGCAENSAVLPALGLVICSERSSGCGCAYNFQTSVALRPTTRPRNENWAVFYDLPPAGAVRALNLNFGVPGDRRDDEGNLWLAFPRPWNRWEPSLRVPVEAHGIDPFGPYQFNADYRVVNNTPAPWLYASGWRGMTQIVVRVAHAMRVTSLTATPVIDGNLDEPSWGPTGAVHAARIRFVPPSIYYREYWDSMRLQESLTDWAMARHDDRNLYIGLFDTAPVDRRGGTAAWRRQASGRDAPKIWGDHFYGVFITDATRQHVIRLGLSASGAQYDALWEQDSGRPESSDWNMDWVASALTTSNAFTAELAIPWQSLADAGLDTDTLELNFSARTDSGSYGVRYLRYPGRFGPERCENFAPLDTTDVPTPPKRSFTVRLHFSEPDAAQPGQRLFDIRIQGQTVREGLDIAREAGAPDTAHVVEFTGIRAADAITVELVPHAGAATQQTTPIISAMSVREEDYTFPELAELPTEE